MKTQRLAVVVTAINLVLLVFLLAQLRPAVAQGVPPVLRGRALEIVDDQGRPRATLTVIPPETPANGERYPETVLFRLITERGRPAVKISTSEEGSGLSLAGGSNTRETYVSMGVKGTVSTLKLKNEDGKQDVVTP